ncbi:hypothetical protein LTR35_002890 [Friedmanniomyces endolithicus]|uniref:Uncharacterized protein n=1 Tax=Friedmanniomyces endolithicus TaxID=329885 RepID=A0AAN6JFT5_9PEZI|nr:hypothetical protein LTS00_014474 [Friedmanniomyces endolithicus]KAK0289692.1 hypothetical protein LTR35_002890 [Friedmanniomyces endolithicus]KAK0328532.1 hypothetical protein LTR82_000463 [Friedmanniomyces endolithicus]KAK1019771.1 hypothetical protein LTR54_000414 [Friedmanniomyces endolithicus]
MSTDPGSDAVVRHEPATKSPRLIAKNTLEGLPDELLIKIVGHTLETREAVNLSPETTRQDVEWIKCQLLRPFARSPKLLAMVESQFREEDLAYRLPLDLVTISPTRNFAVLGAQAPKRPDLFFSRNNDDCNTTAWIGTGAERVQHLEVIWPATPRPAVASSMLGNTWKAHLMFTGIRRAFPHLRSLVVRFTTYRVGDRYSTPFVSHNGPDIVALAFQRQLSHVLAAVLEFRAPHLKDKEIVFHQKPERAWREWRNGPLEEPFTDIQRSHFDLRGPQGLLLAAWQMMDLPSCRLRF